VSFRTLLGLTSIVVNVTLAAMLAIFAYGAAKDAVIDQTLHSVALVAESRQHALDDLLTRRQQRLEEFLSSAISLCGEQNVRGRYGFEEQCLRAAVTGLRRSEGATSTEVQYRNRPISRSGPALAITPPPPGQLAHIVSTADTNGYAMHASSADLTIDVVFDLDEINRVFADRAGLEQSGESFMTDALGYRLTATTLPVPSDYPVRMAVINLCLHGSEQVDLTKDYRGVNVITAARPVRDIGGGCIVANLTYDEAMAPVARLGPVLAYAAAVLGLTGGLVSMVLAGVITRPIKRLAIAARELTEGHLETPIPVAGPSEARQLGLSFSRMAASIRDLVKRERHARFDAEAASRTKDEFLATLSHELRTPLNAILGWASILTHTNYDHARVVHATNVIERNAKVQSQMIDELLDVSRIAAGRMKLHVTNVLVTSAVDAALESARPGAEAKGIHLVEQIETTAPTVKADPHRLQQIIWNLLSNAVRFTPSGGHIRVSVRRVAGQIEIEIQDSGCGIGPEFLPFVFERFRQADSSTTRAHGGLGLGLAIVRDLVELQGGTVTAASDGIDQGTTITVRLPEAVTADLPEPMASGTAHPQGAPLAGAHVLVVDDDPDARDVLKTILEDAGARVTVSTSAMETRLLLKDTRPDLLIADIGMPGEDGYSLLQSIRTLEPPDAHVPAIALTAHSRPEDVQQAIAAGFQLHMTKPIDSVRLVTSITTLFETVH
jgi:signal transduction histidine kinase